MKRKGMKTGVAFALAACLGVAIGCGETGKARGDAAVFIAEKTAAEKGDAKAALALAVFCEGKAGDMPKALEWYRKAADLGDSFAAVEFAYCCETGAYVPKDVEKAREYYRKGATSENEAVRTPAQKGLERLSAL